MLDTESDDQPIGFQKYPKNGDLSIEEESQPLGFSWWTRILLDF
jgi:hypothetical protein